MKTWQFYDADLLKVILGRKKIFLHPWPDNPLVSGEIIQAKFTCGLTVLIKITRTTEPLTLRDFDLNVIEHQGAETWQELLAKMRAGNWNKPYPDRDTLFVAYSFELLASSIGFDDYPLIGFDNFVIPDDIYRKL